ncbi:hypothetical protein [Endozoicomonas sp. ALC066]|uniref:hypothetical protein n=1 Tax=Endozoicomonas sp. ALC066 TaxID=3403078 RepID=UPI003BB59012
MKPTSPAAQAFRVLCPHCGSGKSKLKAKPAQAQVASVTQEVHCTGCNKQWIDTYQLTGMESA